MKKICSIIISLFVFLCFSQPKEEFLKYRIRYGFLNASFASLHLKEAQYEGKQVYHAIGKGETTGLARVFFKVDDTYESYFNKETYLPLFFNRDIYEGGYTKKIHFHFDEKHKKIQVKNLENHQEKTFELFSPVRDVISALYYFRNIFRDKEIQPNEEIKLDLIFDDDELFKFRLKFLRKEEIKTKFGKRNTLVFRPLVQDGRVFKEQESLTLWVSDDIDRVPLKIKANLKVGSLVGDLITYEVIK